MELPVTVVFEPPSQSELRALLRRRRLWIGAAILALAVGVVLVVVGVSRAEAQATARSLSLSIASRPAGAAVTIGGQARGVTPLELLVAPGEHSVRIAAHGILEQEYTLEAAPEGVAFEALLWRREPHVRRLRPSLPGARLERAILLADGRLALVTRTAIEAELRVWRLDPLDGSIEPLSASVAGSAVAVGQDGHRLAYAGRVIGPPASRGAWSESAASAAIGSVIWRLVPPASDDIAPVAVWRAPSGEAVTDISWSPVEDELLAVTRTELIGGAVRSRIWRVPADGSAERDARLLVTLPSEIAPGAHAWSPDGRHVVLLAHTGALNALCLVSMDGDFRYLADLARAASPPLPHAPAAWSGDGRRVAFFAPSQRPPEPHLWMAPPVRRALYVAELGAHDPRLVAEVDGDAAAWREDGRLLVAARQRDERSVAIRVLSATGELRPLLQVPLRVGPRSALTWSVATGQLLVTDASSGTTEYWLVGLAAEQPL